MTKEKISGKKFSEYKDQIISVLKLKGDLGISEPVTLIDGFFNHSIQDSMSSGIMLGGPTIPMVGVVGNKTGRVYLFALKALLPDFEG